MIRWTWYNESSRDIVVYIMNYDTHRQTIMGVAPYASFNDPALRQETEPRFKRRHLSSNTQAWGPLTSKSNWSRLETTQKRWLSNHSSRASLRIRKNSSIHSQFIITPSLRRKTIEISLLQKPILKPYIRIHGRSTSTKMRLLISPSWPYHTTGQICNSLNL